MNCSTHNIKNSFGFEDIKFVLPDTKSCSTNTSVTFHYRFGNKYSFKILTIISQLFQCIFCCFRYNTFIRFTMYHNLPASFINIVSFFIFPHWQSPLLKQVNRRINMTGNVGYQIIPGNPHQVGFYIVNIILNTIFSIF